MLHFKGLGDSKVFGVLIKPGRDKPGQFSNVLICYSASLVQPLCIGL